MLKIGIILYVGGKFSWLRFGDTSLTGFSYRKCLNSGLNLIIFLVELRLVCLFTTFTNSSEQWFPSLIMRRLSFDSEITEFNYFSKKLLSYIIFLNLICRSSGISWSASRLFDGILNSSSCLTPFLRMIPLELTPLLPFLSWCAFRLSNFLSEHFTSSSRLLYFR